MSDSFVTLFISHRDCDRCASAADAARTHASVTGSTGATYNDDRTAVGGLMHIAVVKRGHLVEPGDAEKAAQQVAADHAMDAVVIGRPVLSPRQAPAAEALATFLKTAGVMTRVVHGNDVRMGVLRWAVDQGYPTDVRIALGRLMTAVVNHAEQTIDAAEGRLAVPEHATDGEDLRYVSAEDIARTF